MGSISKARSNFWIARGRRFVVCARNFAYPTSRSTWSGTKSNPCLNKLSALPGSEKKSSFPSCKRSFAHAVFWRLLKSRYENSGKEHPLAALYKFPSRVAEALLNSFSCGCCCFKTQGMCDKDASGVTASSSSSKFSKGQYKRREISAMEGMLFSVSFFSMAFDGRKGHGVCDVCSICDLR